MKKTLSLILVVALSALILSGCNNNKTNNASTDNFSENESNYLSEIEIDSGSQPDSEEKSTSNNDIQYNDNQAIFVAQDRQDNNDDRNTLYYYNHNGELLDSSDPLSVSYFSENNLSPAYDPMTGKIGFIDNDGVFQIEPIYKDAAPFSKDGLALVGIEGEDYIKCGYINSKGEEVIPCIYDDATSFFDFGYAFAINYSNEDRMQSESIQYIIDKAGNVIFEANTEDKEIIMLFNDYYLCKINNTIVSFDYSNNKICEKEFNWRKPYEYELFDQVYDIYYSAQKDCIYIFTIKETHDENGKTKREEINVRKFVGKYLEEEKTAYEIISKRVATTQSGIGYGVVENQKTVIPFEYDKIVVDGKYFICIKENENGPMFDIYDNQYNKTGENINYEFIPYCSDYGKYCTLPEGYFRVYTIKDRHMLHGIVDYTGKVIIEPIYTNRIRLLEYKSLGKFDLLCE